MSEQSARSGNVMHSAARICEAVFLDKEYKDKR